MAHYPNRWLYIALLVALGISTLSEDPKNVFCKGEVVQERNHFFSRSFQLLKGLPGVGKKGGRPQNLTGTWTCCQARFKMSTLSYSLESQNNTIDLNLNLL